MSSSSVEKLKTYLSGLSVEGRKDFAKECLTTVGNLQQIIYVNKKCGAPLAIRIDKASKGEVPCDSLCPEADFDYLRNQALTV
ncbi:MAG: hypothetical protein DI542_08765 [Acinetobacter johnsonii]|uniref:Uncharacterized protein n=1 Tax=Acinetobacter johnsonii TaxID=40214 RepID=A0A2W5TFV8_ACIJO|nr:hypothetical protein [Acinetobacter johnsonii]MDH2047196.1 hypothetical protein [Acinetobacter johnsonii]PZQ90063.1 MAG: hypothetical protein DI542_08765 [Acinetobacter johnsonii]RZN95728.1 hypothetical protein EXE24_00970 [Acinetobacter johnsonii]UIP93969.1 hypothetical protein LXM48_09120 [Acinetobacter johnsonii]UJA00964.1 hypothetical protein GBN93_08460 [Acinetobacter johnsonii]